MIPTLAIDPGNDGGACLLDADGRTALAAWSWRRVQRNKREAWVVSTATARVEWDTLHEVGMAISADLEGTTGAYVLAVEGLFGHGPTLERLSWCAALVAGPLLSGAEGDVLRPLSSQWRPAVLGVSPSTPADQASRLALQRVPAIVAGLGVLAGDEHVCEAAAIARWAWVERRRRAA